MNKCIYLSTCDTCKRIIKSVDLPEGFIMHDLKKMSLDEKDLKYLRTHVDSYLDLVNKRSRKIKEYGLALDSMSEDEIKNYLLKEYTFIKRPIFIFDDALFIGNSKNTITALKQYLA